MGAPSGRRCTDPKQGIKVLSYDLLEGEERAELDAHLQECAPCRDLRDQAFGSEGAFRELEYRAFKLSQRQKVPASAWFARRLQDLWIPFGVLLLVASGLGFWLVGRAPDVPPVQLLRLQTLRGATLDSTATVLVPRLEQGIESIVVQADQDASLLVYETNDEVLRRLLPSVGGEVPTVLAREVIELALPPVESPFSRVLLVVVPARTPVQPEQWDVALLRHFGGGEIDFEAGARRWPEDTVPTMRWLK